MKASISTAALLCCVALPALADDSKPNVEHCDKEFGTLAVAEPQDVVLASLGRYKLGSPAAMLRLLAQESGCFTVVERGAAMQNLQQERALASSGQLQGGSNIGGGQLQAADFVMTPVVQFSEDTGGVGAVVGGLFGRSSGILGAIGGIAGSVKFKEAETSLLVADVRSGIQVASAEGKASKMNFSIGGWGWGALGWAAPGGYSKTPEGKLIAASLLDNYNKIVQAVRSKPTLIRATSQASQLNAAQSTQATNAAPALVAPRPAAPAPTTSGGALSSGYLGAFSGQFSGPDSGVFSVIIASDGRISGVGQSTTVGAFNISGQASAGGAVTMNGSGRAADAQFAGIIDPSTGAVSGTWMTRGQPAGTFSGKRPQ